MSFALAAARRASRFSTVWLALTLLPTIFQVAPLELRKSTWGSTTTRAALLRSAWRLFVGACAFAASNASPTGMRRADIVCFIIVLLLQRSLALWPRLGCWSTG